NRKRAGAAALAMQYLRHKQRHLNARREAAGTAVALARDGVPRREIVRRIGPVVNLRFLERALYSGREITPRVAVGFPTLEEFCRTAAVGSQTSGMVWEAIAAIEPVTNYDGEVYDFTVEHPDHNFIANGFVVSNCGVRLVRSNLFYRDVKHHLRELVD